MVPGLDAGLAQRQAEARPAGGFGSSFTVRPPSPSPSRVDQVRKELERYVFYYTRYHEHRKSREFNQSDLHKAEQKAELIQKVRTWRIISNKK